MKINIYKKIKNFSLFTYSFLVVIRVVLVFIPQYGYIHPDEFFQTSELIAGEIFDINKNSFRNFIFPLGNRRNVSTRSYENLGIQQYHAN